MVDYTEDFLDHIVQVHWPSTKGIVVFHMQGSEAANLPLGYVDNIRLILPDGSAVNPFTVGPRIDTTHFLKTPNIPIWSSIKGPGFRQGTETRAVGLPSLTAIDKDQFVFVNLAKFKPSGKQFIFKVREPAHQCVNENVTMVVTWDTIGTVAPGLGPPTNYVKNVVGANGGAISVYDQAAAFAALTFGTPPTFHGTLMCGQIWDNSAQAAAFAALHNLTGDYDETPMLVDNAVSAASVGASNVGAYKPGGHQFAPGYPDKDFHFPILTKPGTGFEAGFSLIEDPNNWLLAPQGFLPGGVDPSGDFGFEANFSFSSGTFSNTETDHIIKVDAKTLIITQG